MHEPPADLRVFTPGTLTGAQRWAAFGAWRDRRVAYGNKNGWPGGVQVLLEEHLAIRSTLHHVDGAERNHGR